MKMGRPKPVLAVILVLVSLGAIIFYLRSNANLLGMLRNLSLEMVVALVLLRLVFVGLNGVFLKLFAAKLDVNLVWYEWMGLPYITTMGNYLTPLSGGMLARAAYLKNQHGFSYSHFSTLLATNYLMTFWVASLTGAFMLAFLLRTRPFNSVLFAFFLVTWVGISILLLMPVAKLGELKHFGRHLAPAISGWISVKGDRSLVLRLFLLSVMSVLTNGIAFLVGYRALEIQVSFEFALIISLSTVFSALINLTPGNFGVRETFVSFASEIVGIGGGQGLLVALLIRAATLISVFTLGPLFAGILAREMGLRLQGGAN